MKKNAILLLVALSTLSGYAQTAGGPTVISALVPQYCQGATPTNNNRVVCWFWATIGGLTPGGTYRYYTTMDTLNASPTSNGAGVPVLINPIGGTIRRTTNPSLGNPANYDSLTANVSGQYSGWFAVDASGNARYAPGNTIHPLIILNNGLGGSTIATRLHATSYPITVINFGTTVTATTGSALYDSLDAMPRNFICLYDNTSATGRPINIAIVEDDGLDLYAITSTANFYQNMVDTLAGRWGAIVPNNLANGIRALEERDFYNGTPVDTMMDADGWWCSGVNTAMMTAGGAGTYLNSTFVLSSSASIPDTVWVGLSANFNATTNDTGATITWDYGDSGTGSGAMTTHTYSSAGLVSVQVVISNGGCSDTIWHNVVVVLGMNVPRHTQLGFDITPNPSSGIFNVASKSAVDKEVTVYDVLGNTVFSTTYSGLNTVIDLSDLQKGVYFMRIEEQVVGGKTATKRIVIQ